jgi:hypothetical protein
MQIKLLFPAALIVVLVTACGGSTAATNPPPAASQAATGQASNPPAGGKVDCAVLKTAAVELLGVQLLAQLKTPDTVASIKSKTIGNLDPDRFLAAMQTLHALDSYKSALGDPKPAIEAYEKAATAAKVLFATEPIPAFLGHQGAIAGAMDAAGC